MKEMLETARVAHHTLIVLCLALLPLALSPDENGHYLRAVNELTIWQGMKFDGWDGNVRLMVQTTGEKEWMNPVIGTLQSARMQRDKASIRFNVPVLTDRPHPEDPLRLHRNWVMDGPALRVSDSISVLIPAAPRSKGVSPAWRHAIGMDLENLDGKLDNLSVDMTLAEKFPAVASAGNLKLYRHGLWPVDGVCETWVSRNDPAGNDISEKHAAESDTTEIGQTVPGIGLLLKDSAASPVLFEFEGDRVRFLPSVSRYWGDLENKNPKDAMAWLKERRDASNRPFELAGVQVDFAQLALAAPVALAILHLYLLVHLRQIRHQSGPVDARLGAISWFVLFPGLLPGTLTVLSSVIVPTGVTFLLFDRLIQPTRYEEIGGPVCTGLILLFGLLFLREVRAVREKLCGRKKQS